MSIWVPLIISAFLVGLGWWFIWSKTILKSLAINIVVGTIALIYVLAAQKPIEWIAVPILWFAGTIIPIAYLFYGLMKMVAEEEKMGTHDYL